MIPSYDEDLLVPARCRVRRGDQSPTDGAPGVDGAIDDDSMPSSCGANGVGAVTGMVLGVEISPVVRAHRFAFDAGVSPQIVIVLDETDRACGIPATTSQALELLFCTSSLAIGTFTVEDGQSYSCPGGGVTSSLNDTLGMVATANGGGTVTISESDGTCTTGSFTINYGQFAQQLSGTFSAFDCP